MITVGKHDGSDSAYGRAGRQIRYVYGEGLKSLSGTSLDLLPLWPCARTII
jgi:hypothetical protein